MKYNEMLIELENRYGKQHITDAMAERGYKSIYIIAKQGIWFPKIHNVTDAVIEAYGLSAKKAMRLTRAEARLKIKYHIRSLKDAVRQLVTGE